MNAAPARNHDNAVTPKDGVATLPAKTAKPAVYWQQLEQIVTAKVVAALVETETAQRPLVTYLHGLEGVARTECDRRQTIQVIASGRRLLGDRSSVGPVDGPFAHSLGVET